MPVVIAANASAPYGTIKQLIDAAKSKPKIFPDAPTIAESRFKGFDASVWYVVVAPAKTPAAIFERLHAEVQKALQVPEVRERMTAVGGEVLPGSRDSMAALLHSERQRYENSCARPTSSRTEAARGQVSGERRLEQVQHREIGLGHAHTFPLAGFDEMSHEQLQLVSNNGRRRREFLRW